MHRFLTVYACLQLFRPGLQAVGVSIEQLQDDTGGVVFISKGVRLIRIHMHGEGIGWADPDYHIRKDEGAFIAGGDDKDNVIVLDMCPQCIDGGHMDMPFCDDHAF